MKKLRQILALLLISAMLTAIFASCASNKDNSAVQTGGADTESGAAESTDPASTLELPDTDWGGREFRVLGYDSERDQFDTFEVSAKEETGDIVNDAVYRRNTQLEDKYNVVITETKDSSTADWAQSTLPHLLLVIQAGEDLYDLAFTNINDIGTLARNGYLYNLYDVDYINFSKSWWNPEVNDALTLMNKLYFNSSDFSLRDKNRTYIIVYNRDMAVEYNLGDAVDYVRAGSWTYDLMSEWTKAVSNDLNGNGKVDFEDSFGIGFDSYLAFQTMATSCGVTVMSTDSEGLPEMTLNNEHTVSVIDKLIELTKSNSVAVYCNDWNGKVDFDFWSVSSRLFWEGRELFNVCFPHGLKTCSANCVNEYGIIPFPKYDEAQSDYYTQADSFSMLFCIPVTDPQPDFSGFMLEALSAASTDTTLNAYYEVSCKIKYTYDEDSAEMLDLLFSGIRYDTAMVYSVGGSTCSSLFQSIAQQRKNTFSSAYAKIESSLEADIESLIDDLY